MARTTYEYLWVLLAIDPDTGHVWLRQGNPEMLGMNHSDVPLEFERWNMILNQLGGQGWEVHSTNLVEGETAHEQLWLFRREVQ